jgi:hypothetical protein
MLHSPFLGSLNKVKKPFVIAFIFVLNVINASAQGEFTEGVIIFKVDSIISDKPIDSSGVSVIEIRLYKKNNLRRLDIISPPSTSSTPAFIISQIINEKGRYFLIESQIFDNDRKTALFETIDEIEQSRAQYVLTGKIPEFKVKDISEKTMVFETQVETVYRIENDPKRTWELLVAKNLDTSFGLFLTEYINLPGTPFQFYFDDNTVLYHMTAQSLTKKTLDNDLFTVGQEYDVVPFGIGISPFKKN